ncbi:electroneutral sodium bicarbonate exchanger 1-like [Morphnus guianensis]
MPSGRKRQGKSLLLAAVGEESPHRQRPWALLSPLQDAKLLQLQVATRGAFSSCHPVALSKGLQSWGRFLAMGLIAPDVHRWLKFEEDAEDGGERWSKPYVGTLSLHSLSELRSCISNGTVLLDVCANSIEEIAGTVGAASLRERPSSARRGALHSQIKPCPSMPTRDDRGWFINPIGPNPWWTVLAALVPALLCTILIFMDQQISAVIVNRKEHKLKKGCGYHLDLFMVAVMLGVCSVMGLPWFVAATVLSITHVNSLKVESDCSAPGEQPKFLGIREQRVAGLLIFALMGCSVFFTSVLKFIPMPVLYGVFLYMGVSSLRGIQFFDRLKLFWMPAKHQPDFIYLRHVPLRKVHFFTAIQLICLVLLWTIKVSRAAIIFPLMVLALVFVRKAMDLCFSKRELSFLDDLMPERKKKLDDGRNEAGEEEESTNASLQFFG